MSQFLNLPTLNQAISVTIKHAAILEKVDNFSIFKWKYEEIKQQTYILNNYVISSNYTMDHKFVFNYQFIFSICLKPYDKLYSLLVFFDFLDFTP